VISRNLKTNQQMKIINSAITYIKEEKIFLTILIAIHALYFYFALTYGNIYTVDSDEYLQTAVNLKTHGEFYNYFWTNEKIPENYSLRPPVYGVFILALKSLYDSDYFVLFIQNILSIFIWIFLLQLLRNWEIKIKMQWAIILTLVFFPTLLILVNSIMTDILLQLWFVLCLAFIIYYFRSKNIWYIILFNLALTLAVFTKPIMLYFWIPNLIFSVYLYVKNKNLIILLASLLLPLSCYAWSLRNEKTTGYFHFSSIKTQGVLSMYAGYILNFTHGEDYCLKKQEEIKKRASLEPTYKLKSEYIVSESVKIINANRLTYVYIHAKGMANLMLAIGRIDLLTFFPYKPTKEISLKSEIERDGLGGIRYYISNIDALLLAFLFLILIWNIFLLISMLIFFFNSRVHTGVKILILLMFTYLWVVTGPAGYARFKISILPFMIVSVPFFIDFLTQRFKLNKTFKEPSKPKINLL
jgi:hypothetical protein